jgi:hypothetical protein
VGLANPFNFVYRPESPPRGTAIPSSPPRGRIVASSPPRGTVIPSSPPTGSTKLVPTSTEEAGGGSVAVQLFGIVDLDFLGAALDIGDVDDVLGCDLEDDFVESSKVELFGHAGNKNT